MPVSDAAFYAWLRDPGARRVVLLEAVSWFGGTTGTRRFSDRGFTSSPTDTPPNTPYPARIKSVPFYEILMSEQLRGVTIPASGDIELYNEDGELDPLLLHAWDGRPFAIFVGDPSWARADFRAALSGVVYDIMVTSRETMALRIHDARRLIDKPLSAIKVGGTGVNANQIKPVCYGHCLNISPVLADETNNVYVVHDGAIEDVIAVRVNGVSVSFSENTTNGTFTLSSPAAGEVTADVKGAKVGGTWLTKTADIIKHIATARCGIAESDVVQSAVDAMNTLQPATVGFYARDGSLSAQEAIDALALGCGGFTAFDRIGRLRMGIIDEPSAPIVSIAATDIYRGSLRIVRRMIPRAVVRLGYARRWTRQTTLDASVTGSARSYYGSEYSVVEATNSVDRHLLASSNGDMDATLFLEQTAAQSEANRRAALASTVRYLMEIEIVMGAIAINLGDAVRVTHPRYGLSVGRNFLVVGIAENPARRVTRLTLWR